MFELQRQTSITAQARHGKTQVKKTGAAPASSDSVDGADELAQAKREMGIVKSKRARKGKERKGKEASVSQKRGFYFDLGLCASVTKR